MASRIDLGRRLRDVSGIQNVYFNPDTNTKLSYPCIIYLLDGNNTQFSDNALYSVKWRYTVTLITRDPDAEERDKLLRGFIFIRFDRSYCSDGLHHFVYTLYF